jgi:hypothetical protein
MVDNTTDNFFTAKHARLTRIASVANVFAWIILAVQILLVYFRFFQFQQSSLMAISDFMDVLNHNLLYTIRLVVDLVSVFLQGIVSWLVLKGISVGLNMIVETDLNYKEKSQEAAHE